MYLWRWCLISFVLLISGCTYAPDVYLAGAYFPAWLLCSLLSIILTIAIRLALIKLHIDDVLPMRLGVYACIALALTFALLLLFF